MILVLILGGFAWVASRAHIQRDAVKAIRSAGERAGSAGTGGLGGVMYQWEFVDGVYHGNGKSWWPAWLVEGIGVDYFGRVTWVLLPEVSEVETAQIGRLTHLERLDLIGPSVTDARLADIRGLVNLKSLSLKDSAVTDAGLEHLSGMNRLKYLFLGGTKVTNAGVGALQRALPTVRIER